MYERACCIALKMSNQLKDYLAWLSGAAFP